MDVKIEGGAWLRRSSSKNEGKFKEAMGVACSILQVEEMYPDQEKHSEHFKRNYIFFSSHKIYFRPIIRLKVTGDSFIIHKLEYY